MGIAIRKDQSGSDTSCRADRAIDPCRSGSLILGCHGACTSFRPAPCDLGFLPDPGFVLKPDFYGCARGKTVGDFRDLDGEFFLKAGPASGSWP